MKENLVPGGFYADVPLDELVLDIKKSVIRMGEAAGGGYIAQGMCSAEMISTLFYRILRLDPENPEHPDRDRFLLSVGHYAISIYAAMAKMGYFDKDLMDTYSADGSELEMISSELTKGIEMSGGSLGQGLSRGVGLALSGKLRNSPWNVYVYMSDGEMQEGQSWEAAMVAKQHKLNNLITIVDVNWIQVDGRIDEVSGVTPIPDKWRAFGWNVIEIDGNNIEEVESVFNNIPKNDKPTVILSYTVMGNGISKLHGKDDVHYVRWTKEDSKEALEDLMAVGGVST